MDKWIELTYKDSRYEERQYRRNHSRCPQCNQVRKFTQTCIGYMFTDPATHVDGNRVYCVCGFEGIVHDLLPEYDS